MKPLYHVLTGATSGMGLQVAAELATNPDNYIIVGARTPQVTPQLCSVVPRDRLTVLRLDLGLLQSTTRFAAEVCEVVGDSSIRSLVCNAGLQLTGPRELTEEGFERTFVTNYLSHFLLTNQLQSVMSPNAVVVTVGSGTHNADDTLARRFGFRGGKLPGDLRELATGDLGTQGSHTQLGMDLYATSKLCAILIALQMSVDVAGQHIRYYCFDPGLMPGTGLARDRPFLERFGWTYLLPLLRHVIPGVSTGRKSAQALVRQCIIGNEHVSGTYIEYTGKQAPKSASAGNAELAKALSDFSHELVLPYLQ